MDFPGRLEVRWNRRKNETRAGMSGPRPLLVVWLHSVTCNEIS